MTVLIIRFSSIGDIVLTTPVVRCLKTQKGATVHYLSKKSYASILTTNPYIDRVWTIEKRVKEVLAELKQIHFDYIIDLHRNLRSAQVKWALSSKKYSFNKINWHKWLMVQFKINRLPAVHIVDRYMETLTALGIEKDGQGLDYFIPLEEVLKLKTKLKLPASFIAFAIGAAHATKRLPKEKIIAICQQIEQPIVLLGGPAEQKIGAEIAQLAGKHVINTCGNLSLHQSAAVVQKAQKIITHDTGMMHIAAAFHKEIISVWGNTIPAFGMSPYYGKKENRNTSVEVENLSCRPCSKIGFKSCPKGHFKCMTAQQVEEIVAVMVE
ncbi:MAG: glycosyltransferase family 9 protein [Bacteroidota bacterium]